MGTFSGLTPSARLASSRERSLRICSFMALATQLDPLPPVLPPEGVVVTRLVDLASMRAPRVDVAGVRGAADAAIVTALAKDDASRVVVVTEDADAARRLAQDARFFLGRAARDDDL